MDKTEIPLLIQLPSTRDIFTTIFLRKKRKEKDVKLAFRNHMIMEQMNMSFQVKNIHPQLVAFLLLIELARCQGWRMWELEGVW